MLTYCRSLLVAQSISMNKAIGRDVTDKLSAAFATATADATGKDERTIAAPPRGARALGAVAETSFDKGVSWRDEKLVLRLDPISNRSHPPAFQAAGFAGIMGSVRLARAAAMRLQA